jgi:hypothetical protein
MALDVHVLNSEADRPVNWPACQFEEAIHSAVFFGSVPVVQQCPLLRRMQDFYADARYSGTDLHGLVAELQKLLPEFAGDAPVHRILRRFIEVCRDAAAQGKVILCLCD